MLTRIQIRASGETAHDVERQLVFAAACIDERLALTTERVDQVIEGTPGKSFDGRLSILVREQGHASPSVAWKVTSPFPGVDVQVSG